jgi:hypothetical protein
MTEYGRTRSTMRLGEMCVYVCVVCVCMCVGNPILLISVSCLMQELVSYAKEKLIASRCVYGDGDVESV